MKASKLKNEKSAIKKSAWGGKIIATVSGKPLSFREDDDCILAYLHDKDISELLPDLREDEKAIYHIFSDGKTIVSVASSEALKRIQFKENHFYYIHCAAVIPSRKNPSFAPMKDFNVIELGKEGEEVLSDSSRTGSETIKLSLEVIAELNYEMLNYTLRK